MDATETNENVKKIDSLKMEQDGKQLVENEAQKLIIERLEKVLNFVKSFPVSNEESLDHISKPLDNLEASLKYVPNGPFFNDVFPEEIKKYILDLSYPCDSKAFIAATVCQDWKLILENRFKDKEVIIGEKCSKCESNDCVNTTDMLKAEVVHKIDTHLVISKPVRDIDSQLIADALTSVSKFTIANYVNSDVPSHPPPPQHLSNDQLEHLFESIEEGDKIMEEVKLVQLNLQDLNQERLANCLTKNIKRLTLERGKLSVRMLDVKRFFSKLQESANVKLTHLTLENFHFFGYDGLDNVVNALLSLENLKLSGEDRFRCTSQIVEKLMEKVVKSPTKMKSLILDMDDSYDFGSLISSQDLRTLFNKMTNLHLKGVFTQEQMEILRSLPDVEVGKRELSRAFHKIVHSVKKGSNEMF